LIPHLGYRPFYETQRARVASSSGNLWFPLGEVSGLMSWSAPVRAPELSELETLVVCAAEGSMARAAPRPRIRRPGVAKPIGNLEVVAGRELLHRGGHGVRLTEAGAAMQASVQRMLAERDALVGV